jgi:hypothetical protein
VSALWAPLGEQGNEAGEGRTESARSLKALPTVRTTLARFPFIVVLIAVFGVGMAGLLLLNTTLQNQAFQYRALKREATVLAYDQATLQNQLDQLSAPSELARQASAIGMRPNPAPAFVVIPDGKIIGRPKRVSGDEVPDLIVWTPAEMAAREAAAEAKRRAAAEANAAAQGQN